MLCPSDLALVAGCVAPLAPHPAVTAYAPDNEGAAIHRAAQAIIRRCQRQSWRSNSADPGGHPARSALLDWPAGKVRGPTPSARPGRRRRHSGSPIQLLARSL